MRDRGRVGHGFSPFDPVIGHRRPTGACRRTSIGYRTPTPIYRSLSMHGSTYAMVAGVLIIAFGNCRRPIHVFLHQLGYASPAFRPGPPRRSPLVAHSARIRARSILGPPLADGDEKRRQTGIELIEQRVVRRLHQQLVEPQFLLETNSSRSIRARIDPRIPAIPARSSVVRSLPPVPPRQAR